MQYIIYQTAFIGDIILITSLAKTIKNYQDNASIILITTPAGLSVVRNNKSIDEIICYDKHGKDKGLTGFFRLIIQLRRKIRKECIFISPHRHARASLTGFFSGAEIRAGFNCSALSFLYNRKTQYRQGIHETERNMELFFNAVGEKQSKIQLMPPYLDIAGIDSGIDFYSKNLQRSIVLAPGSVWNTKRWPEEYYFELIKRLKQKNFNLYLIGGNEDFELCERLSSGGAVNFAGKKNILESASLISSASLIITNDSAPLHIASAVNTPTIAIFGSTVPYFGFGPLAEKSVILENHDLKCRPCGIHGRKKCPGSHFRCMMEITPEHVFNAVLMMLERK